MDISRNIKTEKAQGLILSTSADATTNWIVGFEEVVEQFVSGIVTVSGVVEVQDAIRSFSARIVASKRFVISASPTMAAVPINRVGTPGLLIPYCRLITAKVSRFVALWYTSSMRISSWGYFALRDARRGFTFSQWLHPSP
jgi:hypothetical protein